MEDRQIIELYFSRNERAIFETSQKYGQYCFFIANNILDSDRDAEECVNDTWLRAWSSIPPQKPGCLRLYLARIVRNLAFNRFKAQQRQKRGGGVVTVALDEIAEFLPDPGRAETRAEEEALMDSVNRFLRSLPERDCSIFIRRYFHAAPTRAIAREYGLTEGNVQKILLRTRNKLKRYLESEGHTV